MAERIPIVTIRGKDYARFKTDRHNWAEQVLPINREAVRCGYCGIVEPMRALPTGGCIERESLKELAN